MNKPISRRTFLKKSLGTLATLTGLGIGGNFYAHNLEPKWLETKHKIISNPLIPKGFHGMKNGPIQRYAFRLSISAKDLQAIVNKINELDPDVILFTGDLMDQPNKYKAPPKNPSRFESAQSAAWKIQHLR